MIRLTGMRTARVMECWGDNVPQGKLTDFRRAVQAKDDAAKGSPCMKSTH